MSVKLVSSDNVEVEVSQKAALMSDTVRNLLEDIQDDAQPIVPLPEVSGPILQKVAAYCEHHAEDPVKGEEDAEGDAQDISPWDRDFCKVDQDTIFELILAANYMDIKPLLDLGCKTVSNMIRGKTPEEIRQIFNIKNDFTAEEEEQVRRENEWAEER